MTWHYFLHVALPVFVVLFCIHFHCLNFRPCFESLSLPLLYFMSFSSLLILLLRLHSMFMFLLVRIRLYFPLLFVYYRMNDLLNPEKIFQLKMSLWQILLRERHCERRFRHKHWKRQWIGSCIAQCKQIGLQMKPALFKRWKNLMNWRRRQWSRNQRELIAWWSLR